MFSLDRERIYPNGKVLTKPSKKNTQAFLEKVRGILETHKTVKAATLGALRNPVMDGGARDHAFGASKKVCSSVDNAIYEKLWWWVQRRHPHKSAAWQKQKYFSNAGRGIIGSSTGTEKARRENHSRFSSPKPRLCQSINGIR